jgi:hypothetical protein
MKYLRLAFLLTVIALTPSSFAAAETPTPTACASSPDPSRIIPDICKANTRVTQANWYRSYSTTELQKFLNAFETHALNIVFGTLTILAIIAIIISGLQYITSQGSPDVAKVARARLMNAVLGLILIVGSYVLIGLITGVINGVGTAINTGNP